MFLKSYSAITRWASTLVVIGLNFLAVKFQKSFFFLPRYGVNLWANRERPGAKKTQIRKYFWISLKTNFKF